jgi:hypothetical protein
VNKLSLVFAACLAALVLASTAPLAAAQSAPVGPSAFYDVTYQGSAQFSADGQDTCNSDTNCFSGPFHISDVFNWKTTFRAVQLSASGASAAAPAAGQQLTGGGDSSDTFCDDPGSGDCTAQHCTGSFSAPDPGGPPLMLSGQLSGSALILKVDAPWQPDPSSISVTGGLCQAAGPYPQFPDALRAVTSIPITQLEGDTITRTVTSTDPGVYQLPPDCTAQAQADNEEATSCGQNMLWSGTVTITPDCTSDAARVGGAAQPPCIKKKQKDDARKSAAQYAQQEQEQAYVYKVTGCAKGTGPDQYRDGAAGACSGTALARTYASVMAQREQAIAADPPAPGYTHVARPHPLKGKRLGTLKHRLPTTYRLLRRYLQVGGLVSAVVTAQNRASGAYQALASGNQAAGQYVALQDKAVVKYAGQAARLLAGQRKLARRARAELRRRASHLHGHRARRFARGMRRLASLVASSRARSADQLAASALKGIGRS